MSFVFSWVGHKRDMRGKHHIYGFLMFDNRHFKIHGECSSACMHIIEYFPYYEMSRRCAVDKMKDGYKTINSDTLFKQYPKIATEIGMHFAIEKLKS